MNRNYGPTILAQRHAEMQGLQQVLWLFGEERQVRSCSLALNNTYGEKNLDSFFFNRKNWNFQTVLDWNLYGEVGIFPEGNVCQDFYRVN